VDVGGGAEDPIVAGIAIVEWALFGIWFLWDTQGTGAKLTLAMVVGLEESGDVGARLD
jgi:hypothetical protein